MPHVSTDPALCEGGLQGGRTPAFLPGAQQVCTRRVDDVCVTLRHSAFGRVYGRVLGIPKAAGRTYLYLNNEKGYSDLALVSVILAVPISIGLTAICALDAYHTRQSMHAHHE